MRNQNENHKEWNERMAVLYHPDFTHNSANALIRYVNRRRREIIYQLLKPQPQDEIIEIGCGAGHVLAGFAVGKLTGVDYSQTLLRDARNMLQGRGAALYEGNAEDLPVEVKKRKFDKIFCTEVIEHVEHPEKVIDEMAAIAHPDSTLVITIPNERLINHYIRGTLRRISFLQRLPLVGKFIKTLTGTPDEWHMQEFSLHRLLNLTRPRFETLKIVPIPWFLPVSYIVSFRLRR